EKGKKRIRVVENTSDDDVGDNDDDDDDGDESPDERGKRRIRAVEYSSDDDDESPLSDNEPMPERPGRRKRTNKIDDMIPDDDDSDGSLTDRSLTESDDNESLTEDDDEASEVSGDDDRGLSEDEVLIEQFTAPDFDDYDYESDLRNLDTNIDFNDSWILLWIFKYQARFRLPDVAIDKLIKFFKIVLSDADKRRFERFPTSSYLVKKLLKIVKQEKTYAVCPDCNTWYKVSEILTQNQNVEFRYTHVEFLNHPKHSKRQACRAKLTNKNPDGANISRRKLNYRGFDDMTEWFMQKDLNEHRCNAEHWRLCKSKAKKIQVLVDLGRIPSKIAIREGFSGYTADQWRSFIMIYATPIMWNLLDEADQKILEIL
ncbi:hypothetical protein RhiirC2_800368, partial [Rhizophagus irregularis]